MAGETKHRIDESLVKRFTIGDMKAFDCIYSAFNQKLQKFIFSLIKTETDTEDLVQEVFVRIWENRTKLRDYGSFDAYLFATAYHTAMTLLRTRVKENKYVEYIKSVQVELDEAESIDGFSRDEISEKLNLLIDQMPPRQREVFKLKHFRNCSYKEIAETLDMSVNTVENHMVKAHKYLKENLGPTYLSVLLFVHLFL